jgi:DnaJ-class molecular chaperone
LSLDDVYHGVTRRLLFTLGGQNRSVDVRIPAGVGDGSRVRIAAEGEPGSGGAPNGDLYLRIRLTPNPTFERKGQDLYARVPIPLTTAVLGGEAEVRTLAGKSLRLKIPPTTQHGQMFRLKGHGMPIPGKAGEHGDLYATADVQLPRQLTPEQRSHFEALQKLERAS